jgi:hypothetical protein
VLSEEFIHIRAYSHLVSSGDYQYLVPIRPAFPFISEAFQNIHRSTDVQKLGKLQTWDMNEILSFSGDVSQIAIGSIPEACLGMIEIGKTSFYPTLHMRFKIHAPWLFNGAEKVKR